MSENKVWSKLSLFPFTWASASVKKCMEVNVPSITLFLLLPFFFFHFFGFGFLAAVSINPADLAIVKCLQPSYLVVLWVQMYFKLKPYSSMQANSVAVLFKLDQNVCLWFNWNFTWLLGYLKVNKNPEEHVNLFPSRMPTFNLVLC